jgi:hypothetical protein
VLVIGSPFTECQSIALSLFYVVPNVGIVAADLLPRFLALFWMKVHNAEVMTH